MSHGSYLLRTDRVPGEEPLPYVKFGKQTLITAVVIAFHAALIIVPFVFLAISEIIKPPVYVMRLPTVDKAPSENPSPHPSPLNKQSRGTPPKGKPLSAIPEIPDLVKPLPPKPQPPDPQPQPKKIQPAKPKIKKVEPVKPKPVPESKKTIQVKQKPKAEPVRKKNKLLTPDQIKVSSKRVRNPNRTRTVTKQTSNPAPKNQITAEQRARDARNAEMIRELRSLSGEIGGKGTPGGGSGPKGIVSKEVNDYYYKVEAYLKRKWEQPSVYGGDRPKVILIFRVDARGNIVYAKIQERSGNPAMDASVDKLVRSLKVLPAPPQAMEFNVTMEIDR